MTSSFTAHPALSLGHWLVALAGSLLLWALAYAQAPNPTEQLGLQLPSTCPLAASYPAPSEGNFALAPDPAPAFAEAVPGQQLTCSTSHAQLAR